MQTFRRVQDVSAKTNDYILMVSRITVRYDNFRRNFYDCVGAILHEYC